MILATILLLAAYVSQQPSDLDGPNDNGEIEHTILLPTAPLTIIIDSGDQGTQITGALEFGFLDQSTGVSIGIIVDWLQIHNGFNLTDVRGLGYEEARSYSFAYLGDTELFNSWESRTPDSTINPSSVVWSPDQKESIHIGDIPKYEIQDLTQAGYIIEYENLRVYFQDGSSALVGPSNLTLGVNFTRIDGVWNTEYILESSAGAGVDFGSNSVEMQLYSSIPQQEQFSTGGAFTVPAADYAMPFAPSPLLTFISVPIMIGLIVIGVIMLASRTKKNG